MKRNQKKNTTKLDELTKDERSLLLYLESVSVDNRGCVDTRKMNTADGEILERWAEERFVECGRIAAHSLDKAPPNRCWWVTLSQPAWRAAHQERRARAERMWKERQFVLTKEL